jgi:hypothetical protein
MNRLLETVEGYQMRFSPNAIASNIARYRSWFDLLQNIRCPVLLMGAKGSDIVTDADFARMQSLIHDCTSFETDHNVHLSDKDEFYICFHPWLLRARRGPVTHVRRSSLAGQGCLAGSILV